MICLRDELKGVERYTPADDPTETLWLFRLSPEGYEAVRTVVVNHVVGLYNKYCVAGSYAPALGDFEDEWCYIEAYVFGMPVNVKDGTLEIVACNDVDDWPDTQHPDFMGPEPDVDELNSDQWIDVLAVFKAIATRAQAMADGQAFENGLEMDPEAGKDFECPPSIWSEAGA